MATREVRTINMINGSISPERPNQHETDPNKTTSRNSISSPSGKTPAIENVLILQGGGFLGAFGCGVFKALCEKNVKINIVAGTPIGGVNAAIIAGSKDGNRPEQFLEQFWLELADSFVDLENLGHQIDFGLPRDFRHGRSDLNYWHFVCDSVLL